MNKHNFSSEFSRILMIGPKSYPPEIGGIEIHVYEISKRLSRMGLDITVVVPSTHSCHADERIGDVTVKRVWSIEGRYTTKASAVPAILSEIYHGDYDLVHAHDVTGGFACSVMKRDKPFVYTLHGLGHHRNEWPTPFRQGIRLMQLNALKRADYVFASDGNSAAIGGNARKHVEILHNGVDLNTFSFNGRCVTGHHDEEPYTVLFVGRLTEVKGVRIMLRAISQIPCELRENMRFVFVGDGPLSDDVKAAKIRFPQIIWNGAVKHESMAPVYRDADLFVLPSHSEGLPIALLEAMAAGVPTIAAKVGGISTDIPHDILKLISPGDSTQLAESIIQKMELCGEAQEMVIKARKYVETKHSWDNAARRVVSVYGRLLCRNATERML